MKGEKLSTTLTTPEATSEAELDDIAVRGLKRVIKEQMPPQDAESKIELNETNDERSEFSAEHRRYEVLPLTKEIQERYPFITKLPPYVGVMGGTARSIARELIAGERELVRDIDLVYIEHDKGPQLEDAELERLAEEFMPDDFAYGHGVQREQLGEYFDTRDLTVNECLVLNGALVVSNFAYNDLQENIIRPTYYEQQSYSQDSSSRNALRGLALQAALLETTDSYPTLEDFNIGWYVSSFDIAVQLNKVMGRGAEVARNFTNLLAEYELLPPELAGAPKAAARYLLEYRVYDFEFRPSADERVNEAVPSKSDPFYGSGAPSQEYHISDPKIQAALAEYDDKTPSNNIFAERETGQYSQAEFDEINQHYYRDEDEYWDSDDDPSDDLEDEPEDDEDWDPEDDPDEWQSEWESGWN